ncbi:MAG: alpha/beta hydrolase, partial [Pseudomonadota bacterium]
MELDDAYDNLGYIPDALAFEPRWTAAAAAFREGLRQRAVIEQSYGPSPRQTYDLFLPEVPAKGVCIFVHGGYWRRFDSSIWSHLASGPLGQGWAVAMP